MIQQLNIRFGEYAISVVRALPLIPRHIDQTQDDTVNEIFNYYKDDLPLDRSSTFGRHYASNSVSSSRLDSITALKKNTGKITY
jgi:hypothetical protein